MTPTRSGSRWICMDCGAIYTERVQCEVNGAGSLTVEIPEPLWPEWQRMEREVIEQLHKRDKDSLGVRVASGVFELRVGRYRLAYGTEGHLPDWSFSWFPGGEWRRTTYGRTLPELAKRVLGKPRSS